MSKTAHCSTTTSNCLLLYGSCHEFLESFRIECWIDCTDILLLILETLAKVLQSFSHAIQSQDVDDAHEIDGLIRAAILILTRASTIRRKQAKCVTFILDLSLGTDNLGIIGLGGCGLGGGWDWGSGGG